MEPIYIARESGIPLVGALQFGIVIRGANNLVQVRPTTVCNIKCPFCSTCANDFSVHPNNFVVESEYLVSWFEYVAKMKETALEANIDSVGEPMTYPELEKLVKLLSKSKHCSYISMQTNGTLLTKEKIDALIDAGLNRINLSLHSLDPEKAQKLAGAKFFDVKTLISAAKYASKSEIELNLTPVWLPGVNDEDIVELIDLAKELKCRISIQKYEVYKHSRRIRRAKPVNYWRFYEQLKQWEKGYNGKLRVSKQDFNIIKAKKVEEPFTTGERVRVKLALPGWYDKEMVGIAKNRCITVQNCEKKAGDSLNVKITENKNQVYLGKEA
tara:strand:- start:765 stop:1745 length:981 start_codon:yes stop_codon:yes gene_type:complete